MTQYLRLYGPVISLQGTGVPIFGDSLQLQTGHRDVSFIRVW
jgi:hypothetical protein